MYTIKYYVSIKTRDVGVYWKEWICIQQCLGRFFLDMMMDTELSKSGCSEEQVWSCMIQLYLFKSYLCV